MPQNLGTIDRQLGLLRFLSTARVGHSVEELAGEFAVSGKTIRRDLNRFLAAGLPVREVVQAHGRRRWRLEGSDPIGGQLRFDEALALAIAVGSIGSLSQTELGQSANSAVRKVVAGLGEQALAYTRRLAGAISMIRGREIDYSERTESLARLMVAREDCRVCFIEYQSRRSTEPLSYPIHPYEIRHYQNAIYVIAFSEQHDEVRCFKLDRIGEVSLEEIPYTIPEDFDGDAALAGAFGIYGGEPETVQIQIAADAARAISESSWHKSQTIETHADGSITLHLAVAVTPELEGWILSIGPDARVLEPDHLARSIAEKARQIVARYTGVLERRGS